MSRPESLPVDSAESGEAFAEPVPPVRERRRTLFAPQHRVGRAGRRGTEVGRGDSIDPAVEAGLLEDRLGEVGPGAVAVRGDVVDAVRQVEERTRRPGEVPY